MRNLEAAILARTTKKPKIVLLGDPLPIFDNPIPPAEELAEIDMISGGRLVSGFVRGTGVESLSINTNPLHNRERFEEAHALATKTWTEPGPWRWEGKHYHFRVVNPFQAPSQKPFRVGGLDTAAYDSIIDSKFWIIGSPETIIRQLREVLSVMRPGILSIWTNDGSISHENTMRCLELMGQEVLPALRETGEEVELTDPFQKAP